jgi:hypothetical protein
MTTKPTTGQTVEIDGVYGTFTVKSINRTRTSMVLANSRGGEGVALLHRSGEWRIKTPVISNQRRIILGEA